MTPAPQFDKRLLRRSFDRAAPGYDATAKLQQLVAERLLGRLEHIQIQPRHILDIGAGTGFCATHLAEHYPRAEICSLDISLEMLKLARAKTDAIRPAGEVDSQEARIERALTGRKEYQLFTCGDAESLPFADNSFDLVISSLTLQWCSELGPTMHEILRVTLPQGLLMFSTFGPDTLYELRESWRQVDDQQHVNEFEDMHNIGDLLFGLGFSEVVMDLDRIFEEYDDVYALMRTLKAIGAHNMNSGRQHTLTGRQRLKAMNDHYETRRGKNGKLPVSYEVLYAHAKAPEPTQRAVSVPFVDGGLAFDKQ